MRRLETSSPDAAYQQPLSHQRPERKEPFLTFPALDAPKAGYEVYVVADAVGGTSLTAHEMALRRIEQAGGKMISLTQLLCELQRDWKREETVKAFMDVFIETGGTMGIQLTNDRG